MLIAPEGMGSVKNLAFFHIQPPTAGKPTKLPRWDTLAPGESDRCGREKNLQMPCLHLGKFHQ
jgi:hypothetical protein